MKDGIDIAERDAETVRRILSSVLPPSAKVLVFGSRANWSAKEFSDLDVAVDAGRKLKIGELAALEDGFADSDLPYRVDVVDLKAISADFAERVLTQGKPFSHGSGGEWTYKRLGDVLELKRGYDLPQQDRRSGNVQIISSSGEVGFHDTAMADAPGVVTGRYGTIGQVFFVDRPYWPLNTALYVRDFKGNDPKFTYYLLKTLDWAQFNDKSGVPGVNRNHVHELAVKVPPLPIQRWIAGTLGSLDDKIELNRRMNETLEAMAQAIFRDWFVDFGPTRRKLDGASDPLIIMGGLVQDTERAQALADLFPAALGDDGLPEGWTVVPLGSQLVVRRGSSPRPIHDYLQSEGLPWVKISDATASSGPYIFETRDYIKTEGLPKTVKLPSGSLILSNSATPGLAKFLELDACIHDGWLWFPDTGEYSKQFLYLAFCRMREEIVSKATGSVFNNLKTEIIRQQPIVKPPTNVLLRFQSIVAPIFDLLLKRQYETRTLAATRDLLIPKLMSGEIRLSPAEDLMEAAQ